MSNVDDPIDIITTADLIAYPGAGNPTETDATAYVELANGLVTEAWKCPTTPVPWWVKAIALEAAARGSRNPRGLQSWTRSVDDASRTERVAESQLKQLGVHLTADERTRLAGRSRRRRRYGSIRLQVG
ncbi:MAG: hypothetical protein CMH83_07155 [Nocardioides sp.]|nr:hypothetical protein [Nocardioides sp.]